nr:nucleosome assembly protein 1;2-like [Tanacetum cinerariifolium]
MSDLGANKSLSAEDRAGLVNALKNKLQNLAGQHSDVLENLTPTVRMRVEVLRDIQSKHDEIEAKFFEERATLELKYQKLYEPLYTKRYDIVNGVVEVDGVKVEVATDDRAKEGKVPKDEEDIDEEEAQELHNQTEQDYEIEEEDDDEKMDDEDEEDNDDDDDGEEEDEEEGKSKRKTKTDPSKNSKMTCWKCGKTGHLKKVCKGVKDGNKIICSGASGSGRD